MRSAMRLGWDVYIKIMASLSDIYPKNVLNLTKSVLQMFISLQNNHQNKTLLYHIHTIPVWIRRVNKLTSSTIILIPIRIKNIFHFYPFCTISTEKWYSRKHLVLTNVHACYWIRSYHFKPKGKLIGILAIPFFSTTEN
jgi:hypothetical protein